MTSPEDDASRPEPDEDPPLDERDDAGATEASDPDSDSTKPAHRQRKHLPVWQETILLLVVALGLAIIIKALFVQAFYIPSESMEPGLVENDRILVQKVSYWFGGSPQRGDVVVFADPGEWLGAEDNQGPTGVRKLMSKIGLYPTGGHLVKRVIGTEGDVVQCCDTKGRIKVNGEPLDEGDYLGPDPGGCNAAIDSLITRPGTGLRRPCNWTIGPVPPGKLLVLGDNRGHSADSRAHICRPDEDPCTKSPWVDVDLVVGKVFSLIWPLDRLTWISRPDTFDDIPKHPSTALREKAEKLDAVP